MFTNIKNRFISVIAPDVPPLPQPPTSDSLPYQRPANVHSVRLYAHHFAPHEPKLDKFAYARPPFLQLLTQDELRASADHNVRPIIVPRDISLLPWGTGYAECVNSGKSEWNEDQAAFCRQVLNDPSHQHPDLPYTYFGIFDGHAGYGAALAASFQFHHILHEKLVDCLDLLLPRDEHDALNDTLIVNGLPHPSHFHRRVTKDELVMGALEAAFVHMDALIAQDRDRYRDAGGCTACVALFIHGKMYVANAGDSRAVLCQRKAATPTPKTENEQATAENCFSVPFSFDHTPETERHRLLNVARLKPNLLGTHYTAMEYSMRPQKRYLGQRILCRQGTMQGWTYKTLSSDDLRMPVVTGEGKRSRLLGTLGVTRGFGDHNLLAINSGTLLKPFLTAQPDVNYRDLSKIVSIPGENNEDGDYGVLIMATDGLWDVSENEAVARTVFQTLDKFPTERHRYTMAAQELVARARGKVNDSGHWRLADSKAAATVDDISVIVIPVYQYYKEHVEWEQKCLQERNSQLSSEQVIEAQETSVGKPLANGQHEADSEDEEAEEDIFVDDKSSRAALALVEVEEAVSELSDKLDNTKLEVIKSVVADSDEDPDAADDADTLPNSNNSADKSKPQSPQPQQQHQKHTGKRHRKEKR